MNIAYFDCFNGAAGDMIVGALIDAGLELNRLENALRTLNIDGYSLSADKVTKQGISATHFCVHVDPKTGQPHRHLSHIKAIIESGDLSDRVRYSTLAVFERLAVAEARVHNTTIEKVHFHEVGAVDAIVDITAACWALEKWGIDGISTSPVPVGSGTVRCEHGLMPVPAPATAELLRGVTIAETNEPGELLTPTGAAIISHFSQRFGPPPAMTLQHVGTGAGTREGKTRPNILRVLIGTADQASAGSTVNVIETDIDDATPEQISHALEELRKKGVLDAHCLPIYMKKGRPGLCIRVLCEQKDVPAVEEILFRETTTFGLRMHRANRTILDRRHDTVETPFGNIRVKVGTHHGKVVTASPEYDDCQTAAREHHVSLQEVMQHASEQWRANQM